MINYLSVILGILLLFFLLLLLFGTPIPFALSLTGILLIALLVLLAIIKKE